jgi:Tfp pilus assembly protein PilX
MVKEKKKCFLKDQTGAAMIIALIMMVVLTLIGIASTFTSTFEIKLSGNKRGATDAFYAADSGVNVIAARTDNFNRTNYDPTTHNYNPFTDSDNVNVTNVQLNVNYKSDRKGPPRIGGYTAIKLEYDHFVIQSIGKDQVEISPIKSVCTLEERVVRILPAQE